MGDELEAVISDLPVPTVSVLRRRDLVARAIGVVDEYSVLRSQLHPSIPDFVPYRLGATESIAQELLESSVVNVIGCVDVSTILVILGMGQVEEQAHFTVFDGPAVLLAELHDLPIFRGVLDIRIGNQLSRTPNPKEEGTGTEEKNKGSHSGSNRRRVIGENYSSSTLFFLRGSEPCQSAPNPARSSQEALSVRCRRARRPPRPDSSGPVDAA
jgi:hypothetical protein